MAKVIGLLEQNYLKGVDDTLEDIKGEFLSCFIDVYHKKLNVNQFEELFLDKCEKYLMNLEQIDRRTDENGDYQFSQNGDKKLTYIEIKGMWKIWHLFKDLYGLMEVYKSKENIEKDFPKDENLPF